VQEVLSTLDVVIYSLDTGRTSLNLVIKCNLISAAGIVSIAYIILTESL